MLEVLSMGLSARLLSAHMPWCLAIFVCPCCTDTRFHMHTYPLHGAISSQGLICWSINESRTSQLSSSRQDYVDAHNRSGGPTGLRFGLVIPMSPWIWGSRAMPLNCMVSCCE